MALGAVETKKDRLTIASLGPRVPDVAFCLALAAQTIFVMTAPYLPYVDAINHLARWVMMDRFWSGDALAGMRFVPRPSNYLIPDLMGAALVHLFGFQFAFRSMAMATSLLPGVGLYALLRVVAPQLRGWALVGLLLGINRYFLTGYINYQLGLGLVFLWLALYWRFKSRPSPVRVAWLMAFGLLVSQVHLSSVAVLTIVVGWDAVADAIVAGRTDGIKAALSTLYFPASTLTFPFLAAALTPSGWSHVAPFASSLVFRGPLQKCRQIIGPFFTLSALQSMLLACGYAVSVATFAGFVCRPGKWNRNILAVASLFLCFAVFPVSISGTYDVDVRFLLPAYLLVFISRTPRGTRLVLGGKGLVVPFVACLLVDGAVAIESRAIAAELLRYDAVLEQIPPRQTVLDVVTQPPHFGVPIYKHFAHWEVVKKSARLPGTFGSPHYPYFEHFRLVDPVEYEPDLGWQSVGKPVIDPVKLSETYDFVVVVGEDKAILAQLERVASVVVRRYPVTLLRVMKDAGTNATQERSRRGSG
jgi:hypothetical protein